jgi:hypothetical protein
MRILSWSTPRRDFVYPAGQAPRTAVLRTDLRVTRPAKCFETGDDGVRERLARFEPCSLAGSFEKLLAAGRGLRLRNAVIVFTEASSPVLTEAQRDLLWRLFEVPVFEQVLAADGRLMATECEAHSGLHLVWGTSEAMLAGCITRVPCGCGLATPRLIHAPASPRVYAAASA